MNSMNFAQSDTELMQLLMEQESRNFVVEVDQDGITTYHWIDTRFELLSSRKLWELLECAKASTELCSQTSNQCRSLMDAITDELIRRDDYEEGRPMLRALTLSTPLSKKAPYSHLDYSTSDLTFLRQA